jgi:hypothetical protein
MSNKFTSNEIILLLILAVTAFIKAVITITVDASQLFYRPIYDKYFGYVNIFSDVIFILYFLIAIYFIFIKKVTEEIMLFIFLVLILKFIVYYILTFEIYIYSSSKNVDMKKLEQLEKFKHYIGIVTGFFLLFVSFYVIRKVLI